MFFNRLEQFVHQIEEYKISKWMMYKTLKYLKGNQSYDHKNFKFWEICEIQAAAFHIFIVL